MIPIPNTGAEHDHNDHHLQEVDEIGLEKFDHGRGSDPNANVQPTGSFLRLTKRFFRRPMNAADDSTSKPTEKCCCFTDRILERHLVTSGLPSRRKEHFVHSRPNP